MKTGDYVSFINLENQHGAYFHSVPIGEVVTAQVVYVWENGEDVEVKHIKHGYGQTVAIKDLIRDDEDADDPESENELEWYATAPALYQRRKELNTGGY